MNQHLSWLREFKATHKLTNQDIANITLNSEWTITSWMKTSGPSARVMPDTVKRTLELWSENKEMKTLLTNCFESFNANGHEKELRKKIKKVIG